MKNLSVNSIQVKPRGSVTESETFSSVLVFLRVRIQSRDRDCAASDVRSLSVKQIHSKDYGAAVPREGSSPSLHCGRLCISVGRTGSGTPHSPAGAPYSLLAPMVVRAHYHGPEEQGVPSAKRDVFPSLSGIFPSFCFRAHGSPLSC